jgi:hypothetical protein
MSLDGGVVVVVVLYANDPRGFGVGGIHQFGQAAASIEMEHAWTLAATTLSSYPQHPERGKVPR